MMDVGDLSLVDVDVLRAVKVLREEFDACTGTAVSGKLGFSKSYVFERIHALADHGLLVWNTMPGSLRLTDAGAAFIARADHPGATGAPAAPELRRRRSSAPAPEPE
jgi:DNA-binding IclR family transcriptional regulator